MASSRDFHGDRAIELGEVPGSSNQISPFDHEDDDDDHHAPIEVYTAEDAAITNRQKILSIVTLVAGFLIPCIWAIGFVYVATRAQPSRRHLLMHHPHCRPRRRR